MKLSVNDTMHPSPENQQILRQIVVIEHTATAISKAAISLSEKLAAVTPEALDLAILASKLLNQANTLRELSDKVD